MAVGPLVCYHEQVSVFVLSLGVRYIVTNRGKNMAQTYEDACREMQREKTDRAEATPPQSALDIQIGGSHYKDFAIQPVEFIHRNGIPFIEGNCIKYLCRWRAKNGVADLEKVKHYINLLIEMESRK